MMHIKYKIDKSTLHGVGIFTEQDIKKGDLIFTASPVLDVNITQEQFDSLQESEQKEIKHWGFFDEPSQKWHVDFDRIHFINHSYDANTTQDFSISEAHLTAVRGIQAGEELTQNYLEFESPEDLAKRGIPAQ
jgi:SET domain-containing protein